MKRFAMTSAAAILIASPALAALDFEATDVNGDGFVSMPEALAAYPDMDPTDFDELDTTEDRLLDVSEANSGRAAAMFAGYERGQAMAEPAGFDMTQFDTDGDSALSYDEVNSRIPGVPEVYFQDFDTDSNGVISSEEANSGAFQNLLNKYGS